MPSSACAAFAVALSTGGFCGPEDSSRAAFAPGGAAEAAGGLGERGGAGGSLKQSAEGGDDGGSGG